MDLARIWCSLDLQPMSLQLLLKELQKELQKALQSVQALLRVDAESFRRS